MNLFSHRLIGMPSFLGWDPMNLLDVASRRGAVWNADPIRVDTSGDQVRLSLDLPGVDPEHVDLSYERGELTISAKRDEQVSRYRVALGDSFDPDSIEASLDKGVLTLVAHKRPEAKPRKIALSAGSTAKQLGDG